MPFTRRALLSLSSLSLAFGVSTVSLARKTDAKVYARRIAFADADAFDQAMSKAMTEGFEAIDVELPPAAAKRMPARLRAWVQRIANTGGEVRFRDVTPKSRGVWVVLIEMIASIVGPYVIEEIRKAMRDPTTDYHAVIVGQGTDPATAEVLGVEFYKRGSPSWAEAYDKSKAMKLQS